MFEYRKLVKKKNAISMENLIVIYVKKKCDTFTVLKLPQHFKYIRM